MGVHTGGDRNPALSDAGSPWLLGATMESEPQIGACLSSCVAAGTQGSEPAVASECWRACGRVCTTSSSVSPSSGTSSSRCLHGRYNSPPACWRSRNWIELPGVEGQVVSSRISSSDLGLHSRAAGKLCSAAARVLRAWPSLRGAQGKNNASLCLADIAHPSPPPGNTENCQYSAEYNDI